MEHVRLSSDVDRVLHIGLSEEDWKAFLAVAPQPVTWLREKIREAINQVEQVQKVEQVES
jgi:hypothetical protein